MSLYLYVDATIQTNCHVERLTEILTRCAKLGCEFIHLENKNQVLTLDGAIALAIDKMNKMNDDILCMKTPLSSYFIDIYFLKEEDGLLFSFGGFERNLNEFKLRYIWRDIYYQPYIKLMMNIVGSYNIGSFIVGAQR